MTAVRGIGVDTIEQIKSFLTEMATQDNRCTAMPFFYVIRTKVKDPAPLENCSERRWYWGEQEWASEEEIKKYCKDNDYSEKETKAALNEACEFGVRDRWENRGMFLTESDAERHLKLNYYHYSPDAHTYVMHAWRAPELEKFIKNLMIYFEVKP